MFLIKRLGFLCITLFALVGCSVTMGSSKLLQQPVAPVHEIALDYVKTNLHAAQSYKQGIVSNALANNGIDQLGGRIAMTAPEILIGKSVRIVRYSEMQYPRPLWFGKPDVIRVHYPDELIIKVSDGYTNAAGNDITLTFVATFWDAKRNMPIWTGNYRSMSESLSLSGDAFDDAALRKLLTHIFDDMVSQGLIGG